MKKNPNDYLAYGRPTNLYNRGDAKNALRAAEIIIEFVKKEIQNHSENKA